MIKIDFKFPDLFGKMKKLEKNVMLVLAAAMQTNRAMMFDKDGADNGKKKWRPLLFRNGRPLQKSGVLRKSLAPPNSGKRPGHAEGGIVKMMSDTVTIGTNLHYARLMNDGTVHMSGGVLRPVNAQALMIPLPTGKSATPAAKRAKKSSTQIVNEIGEKEHVMFRKSVKIPARPMDTITKKDEQEFADTVANYLGEEMSR